MNSCVEYIDLISSYADGELPVRDKQRVEEHLRECEHCAALLSLYREISISVDEACENPPEALRGGVMSNIFSGKAFGRKKKPLTARSMLMKFGPMAACSAILLAGIWFSYRFQTDRLNAVQMNVAAPSMPPTELSESDINDTVMRDTGVNSYDSVLGGSPDTAPQSAAETGDDHSQIFTDGKNSAAEPESALTRSSAGAGGGMDMATAENDAPRLSLSLVDSLARSGEADAPDSIYAAIKKTGEFPEFLSAFENWSQDEGLNFAYIYVPRNIAAPLLDGEIEGVSVEFHDEESGWVLVMYYPE